MSPVIGTLLLLAVTVVLAGIVAGFVLGAAEIPSAKTVGILAEEQNRLDLHMVLTSGHDINDVIELRIAGDNGYKILNKSAGEFTPGTPLTLHGATMYLSGPGPLTITGVFPDGTAQVLWQKRVTPSATLTYNQQGDSFTLTWSDEDLFSAYEYLIVVTTSGKSAYVPVVEGPKTLTFKSLSPQSGECHLKIYGSADATLDEHDTPVYDGTITIP